MFRKRDVHRYVNLERKGTKLKVLFCTALHVAMVEVVVKGDDWEADCCSMFDEWTDDGWCVLTDEPLGVEGGDV